LSIRAREVAGLLPHAELVTLSGDAHLPGPATVTRCRARSRRSFGIEAAPATAGESGVHVRGELSERERKGLGLVAQGFSDAQIAERLGCGLVR